MSNFCKVEHIKCFHTNSKELKNISSKIYLKTLSRLTKFYISHQYYSQWKLTKIHNFMSIIESLILWQNEIDILYSW